MIKVINLSKNYRLNRKNQVGVLVNLNFEITDGDLVAVVGKSGAGKSTLLSILSGLDFQTSGDFYFDGKLLENNNTQLAKFRRDNVGLIVQNFALIGEWTVFDNMALPLKYKKLCKKDIRLNVYDLAEKLGISHLLEKHPATLSGGENQRVAIGRAIIAKPRVLLADEPTASLDEENKIHIFDIMKNLNEQGMTVIIATHDKMIYEQCHYQIKLGD